MRATLLAAGIALLAAAAPAMGLVLQSTAAGAGVGSIHFRSEHSGASCPVVAIALAEAALGPVLAFRAGGVAATEPLEPTQLDDTVPPCAMGTTATFGASSYSGSAARGYTASRVSDYGAVAGLHVESLTTGPLDAPPVWVRYSSEVVGGLAPTLWVVEGFLLATTEV